MIHIERKIDADCKRLVHQLDLVTERGHAGRKTPGQWQSGGTSTVAERTFIKLDEGPRSPTALKPSVSQIPALLWSCSHWTRASSWLQTNLEAESTCRISRVVPLVKTQPPW